MELLETLRAIATQLEGPYKWHVIAVVVILLTAGITQYIFKTFKWFILVVLLAIFGGGIVWFVALSVS